MKSVYVDKNGRAVQCTALGIGKNVSAAGVVPDIPEGEILRIKAISDSVIKESGDVGDGVAISAGETEYFFINGKLELVSGSINIMY